MHDRNARGFATIALTITLLLQGCTPTRTRETLGEGIDDATLTARVKAALVDNPRTPARNIDVESYRGNVQLNGFVASRAEVDEATRVVKRIPGVDRVENNLRVQRKARSAGDVVDDVVLTAKVKAALVADSRTKANQINVEIRSGVVQLAGFVDSEAARSAALEIARGIVGVRDVDNQLAVK